MIDAAQIQPPVLGYRHMFEVSELEEAFACMDQHGFAVIRRVIDDEFVHALRQSVHDVLNPNDDLGPGQSRVKHAFVEHSPTLWRLLDHEPWMRIMAHSVGGMDMRFHRSAAIVRQVGAPGSAWHTDWSFRAHMGLPPRGSGDILNRFEYASGKWFYLEGTEPIRGGLAVIEDSHHIDWPGPDGFEFTADRVSFHRKGTDPKSYTGWDVPGIVPLFTEPGDMILFAARTYHFAFPNQGKHVRHSCGLGVWPRSVRVDVPWDQPASARWLAEQLPERHRGLLEGYPSIDPTWKPPTGPSSDPY